MITSSQWGMVTTAQAQRVGVSRLMLSRLEKAGALERLANGVYKDSGVPSDRFEGVHAMWLSLHPAKTAENRLTNKQHEAVVTLETAAWLHNIGDFVPEPYRFSTPKRKQTQRGDLQLRTKQYPVESIEIVEGLPVTGIEQTIADLVEANTDISLMQDLFLHLSATTMDKIDEGRLSVLLSPLAQRNGFEPGDGTSLRQQLMVSRTAHMMDIWQPIIEQITKLTSSTQKLTPEVLAQLHLPNGSQ